MFHYHLTVLWSHPTPCLLPFISSPYRKAFLHSRYFFFLLSASEGLPSSRIFCLTVSPLIPRRRHKPLSNSSVYDADFVYKIKTRPPLSMLFTRLPLCSFALQPGRLRRVLSDYFVESLRINPFPDLFRFLATWL
jgi:hypothetical protein